MKNVPSDRHVITPNAPVVVNVDGTWQTRGYSSFNRVVTAMLGRICIDNKCYACTFWKSKTPYPEYDEWCADLIIYVISTVHHRWREMESSGAVTIFQRSVEKK